MALAEGVNKGSETGSARGIAAYLASHLREYGLLFALIAIMAFFQVVTSGTLLRPINLTNLLLQNSYIVIMALGMLIVIVSGNIDLSVGSVMGFVGALAAVMIVEWELSTAVTMVTCLVAGGLIGAAAGSLAELALPAVLGAAAGAMLYIISDEIIPETHRRGFETPATFALMTGMVVMMFLDTTLG